MSIGLRLLTAIVDKKDLKLFTKLSENVFIEDEQEAYHIIKKYVKEYGELPSTATLAELLDEEALLIPDSPIELLLERCVERKFKEDLMQASMDIENALQKHNLDEALSVMKKIVDYYRTIKRKDDGVYTFNDLIDVFVGYIHERRQRIGQTFGIPTGWKSLDEAVDGYQPADLNLILARPKKGKSMLMAYSAWHASQAGYKAMLISMEMGLMQQAKRIIALANKLKFDAVKKGEISTFAERKIIEMKQSAPPLTYVDGRFQHSLDDIFAIIEQNEPEIVFIDGGYLIKVQSKYKSKWEAASEIAQDLKLMAMNFNIPFIVSFQFNREAPKTKSGGLEHIHLTDALSQLCSLAMGISGEETDNIKTVEVIANREGTTCIFQVKWDWERMDFSEVETELPF